MGILLVAVLLCICVFLFCRQVHLDRKSFAHKHQSDNEDILREAARFLKERGV